MRGMVIKIRAAIDYSYTLNGSYLECVHHQDVGVTIHDTLLPHTHIRNITSKANKKLEEDEKQRRCFSGLDKVKFEMYIKPKRESSIVINSGLVLLIVRLSFTLFSEITQMTEVPSRITDMCHTGMHK